ncbi:MAG TPA: hypothetical protein ENO20_07625 [Bacteroides sp.]|nr:hypothetical protein [Bacteroides sp.]
MSNEKVDLNKIIRDSRDTLLNPKSYFSALPLKGGFAEPVIKVAIYGFVAGLFAFLWSILGLSAMGGTGIMGGAVGIMALVWAIVASIVGLFVGAVIMLVISAICGGNTDFEANLRVTASLMVIYPIQALLSFFYGINLTLGGLVWVIVALYAIYLLYLAITLALKGKESAAKIVALVLVVLMVIGFFAGRKANKVARDYSDELEQFRLEQLD